MKITAKAMTYKQYKDFTKFYTNKKKDENLSDAELAFDMAEWVAKHVYDIDPEKAECSGGTFLDLLNKTRLLSDMSEVEDLKNLNVSGIGE